MSTPAAGWYPDADVVGGERWWDGVQWSDNRRPSAPAIAPEAAPPVPLPPVAPGYTAAPADAAASTPGIARPAPGGYTVPPAYAAPSGAQPAAAQQNVLAIAGLIVSIVSLFIGIIGVVPIAGFVLSLLGFRKAPELGGRGRRLAIAGMIVAGVSLVFLFGTMLLQAVGR